MESLLGPTADVALVNFWLHDLFSQIDMMLKDTLVTTSSKNSVHFLKVMFALTMMFNCKDLSHWPVEITVHYLPSTSLLPAAWRRLSTGWRNTVMTRLKTL